MFSYPEPYTGKGGVPSPRCLESQSLRHLSFPLPSGRTMCDLMSVRSAFAVPVSMTCRDISGSPGALCHAFSLPPQFFLGVWVCCWVFFFFFFGFFFCGFLFRVGCLVLWLVGGCFFFCFSLLQPERDLFRFSNDDILFVGASKVYFGLPCATLFFSPLT